MKSFYWRAVIAEVLNKNNPNYAFIYTAIGCSQGIPLLQQKASNDQFVGLDETHLVRRTYPLGEEFKGLHLTQREMQSILGMLHGETAKETAIRLEISRRTVEYYLKNVREKLGCHCREQVMAKILRSDLLKGI